MPVHRYAPTRPADVQQLVDQLAAEWRSPDPNAAEPVILEEPDSNGKIAHVFVVWDAWAHLDRVVRGEIIMDAAARVKPATDIPNISIAMGLTPDEADRYRLQWR